MRWGLDSSFFLEVKWHFRRSFLSSGGDLHHRGGKYDKKKMRLFILHGGERHHPIIKSMEERDIYMMSSSFLFQWFVVQMASLEVDHESAELTRLSYHFYRSHSVEFLFCVVFLFFISHRLVESNNISSAFFLSHHIARRTTTEEKLKLRQLLLLETHNNTQHLITIRELSSQVNAFYILLIVEFLVLFARRCCFFCFMHTTPHRVLRSSGWRRKKLTTFNKVRYHPHFIILVKFF